MNNKILLDFTAPFRAGLTSIERSLTFRPASAITDWNLRQENNDFLLLRLLLALTVIYSHSYPLTTGHEEGEIIRRITGKTTSGAMAVDAFFVISGFLITQSFLRQRSLASYFTRRILRIYPAFIIAALSSVVVGLIAASSSSVYVTSFDISKFLLGLSVLRLEGIPLTLQNIPFPNAVNGSLWTIQYEFVCYIVLAIIGIAGILRSKWSIFIIFSASLVAYAAVLRHNIDLKWNDALGFYLGYPINWPRLITYFLSGSCFFLWKSHIPLKWYLAIASVVAVALSLFLSKGIHLTCPLLGTYAIMYLAFAYRGHLSRQFLGNDISYGVYLYAFPVQQLFMYYNGGLLAPLVLFSASALVAVAIALLSWRWIEQPALSIIRSSLKTVSVT